MILLFLFHLISWEDRSSRFNWLLQNCRINSLRLIERVMLRSRLISKILITCHSNDSLRLWIVLVGHHRFVLYGVTRLRNAEASRHEILIKFWGILDVVYHTWYFVPVDNDVVFRQFYWVFSTSIWKNRIIASIRI